MAKRKDQVEGLGTSLSREDIEALIEILHEKGISEFEYEQEGMRLHIIQQHRPEAPQVVQPAQGTMPVMPQMFYPMGGGFGAGPGGPPPQAGAPAEGAPAAPAAAPAPSAAETAPTEPAATEDETAGMSKVNSPMVGTFYLAPAPGAKPFVEVGDKVDENSVLCIIEAMKLMNEIKAETGGIVRKILVDNAQPVEYGQALFLIEPA